MRCDCVHTLSSDASHSIQEIKFVLHYFNYFAFSTLRDSNHITWKCLRVPSYYQLFLT